MGAGVGATLGGSHSASAQSSSAAGSLDSSFQNPPDASKVWVYWWWLNGNVSRDGITRDLEEMKRQGINGVLLFHAGGGRGPKGPAFLSPDWMELFRFAVAEAARLGMEMSINLCDGWDAGGIVDRRRSGQQETGLLRNTGGWARRRAHATAHAAAGGRLLSRRRGGRPAGETAAPGATGLGASQFHRAGLLPRVELAARAGRRRRSGDRLARRSERPRPPPRNRSGSSGGITNRCRQRRFTWCRQRAAARPIASCKPPTTGSSTGRWPRSR